MQTTYLPPLLLYASIQTWLRFISWENKLFFLIVLKMQWTKLCLDLLVLYIPENASATPLVHETRRSKPNKQFVYFECMSSILKVIKPSYVNFSLPLFYNFLATYTRRFLSLSLSLFCGTLRPTWLHAMLQGEETCKWWWARMLDGLQQQQQCNIYTVHYLGIHAVV